MPNYDYKCNKCGKEFEHFQSINADALTMCLPEVCEMEKRGEVVRKISRGTGVILKGTGFYETDYVRSKAPASSES